MKRKTQEDQELRELKEGIKTFSDPPADDLVAGIRGSDSGEWDHALYMIESTLDICNDKRINHLLTPGNLPLLTWFEHSTKVRLKTASGAAVSDLHRAAKSVEALKGFFVKRGKADIGAMKAYLHTIILIISLLRSGAIRSAAMARSKQIHAERDKRCRPILLLCRRLMKARKYKSAESLLKSFPNRGEAAIVDGAKVFREDWKACCCMPNGKEKSVGLEKFYENYFLRIKQEEKNTDNS